MSSQPPSRPSANRQRQYYFAYGSNLHLKQMAKRCPSSKYVGRARLPNYLWQINERGFANIVRSDGNWVEGLVYELNGGDEERLDKSEGVSKDCYSKKYESLEINRAAKILYRRPVSWIVEKGGPARVLQDMRQAGKSTKEHAETIERHVLVYMSSYYTAEGGARDEYTGRINLGVADAMVLGVSGEYIKRFVRPYVQSASQPTAEHTGDRSRGGVDANRRRPESRPRANKVEDTVESRSSRGMLQGEDRNVRSTSRKRIVRSKTLPGSSGHGNRRHIVKSVGLLVAPFTRIRKKS